MTSGVASLLWCETSPKSQVGSLPRSAHAACFAAPSATYSPAGGTKTSRPNKALAITGTAGFFAAPPMSRIRLTPTPNATRASTASAKPANIPSTIARAISSGFELLRFMPAKTPVAVGRFGVRSPSK